MSLRRSVLNSCQAQKSEKYKSFHLILLCSFPQLWNGSNTVSFSPKMWSVLPKKWSYTSSKQRSIFYSVFVNVELWTIYVCIYVDRYIYFIYIYIIYIWLFISKVPSFEAVVSNSALSYFLFIYLKCWITKTFFLACCRPCKFLSCKLHKLQCNICS